MQVDPSTLWSAAPLNKTTGMADLGLVRNANMPVEWSLVGKLYHYQD